VCKLKWDRWDSGKTAGHRSFTEIPLRYLLCPRDFAGVLRVLRVHDPRILRWFSSSSAFKKRPMGTRYSISQCAGTQNAQSWFRAKWKQKVTSKTHESFWEILRVFVIYVKKMYHLQFIWSKAGNGTDKSIVAAWFPHFLDFQRVWKR
jgi:hypothetical protein